MRFTIDRINDLRKHYGEPPVVRYGRGALRPTNLHEVMDGLDNLAGQNTRILKTRDGILAPCIGERVEMHEAQIEFGLPYFWLGREAEENR